MIAHFEQQLKLLEEQGQLRSIRSMNHKGYQIQYEGKTMTNLSGNDYLGIGGDDILRKNFLREMMEKEVALGSCSSRLLTGNHPECDALEYDLKSAYGKEAALLFNSGYHANVGIVGAIANRDTLVLCDKLVHASIIDGVRLSEGTMMRYRHNDLNHLETLLKQYHHSFKHTVIITESIFSMDGDCAKLKELVELKNKYPLMLYVDEAHAVGVRGKHGLGLVDELGIANHVDIWVGTFGKALASMGAFLVCDSAVRELLVNRCRPLIFSTALPPLTIAWSRYIFEQRASMDDRRSRLQCLCKLLGNTLSGGESHIIPQIIGENERAIEASKELQKEGFFVLPIRPPTVPKGSSRLRFSISANIPFEEIERLGTILNRW